MSVPTLTTTPCEQPLLLLCIMVMHSTVNFRHFMLLKHAAAPVMPTTILLHWQKVIHWYFHFPQEYRSDSQIRTQKSQIGTPLFLIFSSLSHFLVKPVTLYYAKIKSSKSKSAHIFWIGWLINEKSGCLCLRNNVLIYESLRYPNLTLESN